MYKIDQTDYGIKVTCSGKMTQDDIDSFRSDLLGTLAAYDRPFSMLVDLTEQLPIEQEVLETLVQLQTACLKFSCRRAALIVKSPVVKAQAVQICFRAKSENLVNIFDSSKDPDWEEKTMRWLYDGVEPYPEPVEVETE